jgi:DNA-nicking Smr family endonuclease
MPRRRLHGETQKERQKKASRLLKLRGSARRKQQTATPLPFEASPELDPQDIEFLEAMRDLRVRRLPGQGGTPVRREAYERVRFAADAENDALFQSLMRDTGVAPLGEAAQPGALSRRPAPSRGAAPVPADDADIPDAPWAVPEEDEPRSAPHPATEERASGLPPALNPRSARRAPADAAPRPGGPAGTRAPAEGTRFDESEDGARIMEEALRSDVASLNEKFQGAVRGTGKRKAVSRSTSSADPDDELDLHGKTQEEAIRMVQNFLLRAKHKRLRAVLIITGRGLNSGEAGPVLRNAVQSWLERNAGSTVRRFAWAPPRLGGDGAIWVELW